VGFQFLLVLLPDRVSIFADRIAGLTKEEVAHNRKVSRLEALRFGCRLYHLAFEERLPRNRLLTVNMFLVLGFEV